MTDLEKELVEAVEALICHVCNNRIGWKRQGWFTGRACAGCDGIRAVLAHAHEAVQQWQELNGHHYERIYGPRADLWYCQDEGCSYYLLDGVEHA